MPLQLYYGTRPKCPNNFFVALSGTAIIIYYGTLDKCRSMFLWRYKTGHKKGNAITHFLHLPEIQGQFKVFHFSLTEIVMQSTFPKLEFYRT